LRYHTAHILRQLPQYRFGLAAADKLANTQAPDPVIMALLKLFSHAM